MSSRSSKYRRKMKEDDPEKWEAFKIKERERCKAKRAKKKEKWLELKKEKEKKLDAGRKRRVRLWMREKCSNETTPVNGTEKVYKGLSCSARVRRQMKENNPEKWEAFKVKERERCKAYRAKRKERWLLKEFKEERERVLESARRRGRHYYWKNVLKSKGEAAFLDTKRRTLALSSRKRPKDMTADEFRLYKNRLRAELRARLSSEAQERIREKDKEYQRRKRLEASCRSQSYPVVVLTRIRLSPEQVPSPIMSSLEQVPSLAPSSPEQVSSSHEWVPSPAHSFPLQVPPPATSSPILSSTEQIRSPCPDPKQSPEPHHMAQVVDCLPPSPDCAISTTPPRPLSEIIGNLTSRLMGSQNKSTNTSDLHSFVQVGRDMETAPLALKERIPVRIGEQEGQTSSLPHTESIDSGNTEMDTPVEAVPKQVQGEPPHGQPASTEDAAQNAESQVPQKVTPQHPPSSSGKRLATGSSSSSPKKPAAASNQHYSLLRFPLRVGITWKKGERVEAMDFSRTWYPSKIVEIDEEDKHVLIHFEGWNSRYDEWVAMDSDKLRPQTRHSERKDKGNKKRRNLPQPVSSPTYIYCAGEPVLARWTDCKKYPATINRAMDDGSYEVVFFDGVTRLIQPINIQPMPEERKLAMQEAAKPLAASTSVKSSFKDVPLTLPDHVLQRTKSTDEQSEPSASVVKVLKPEAAVLTGQPKKPGFVRSSLKTSPLKKKRFRTSTGLIKRESYASRPMPTTDVSVASSAQSETVPVEVASTSNSTANMTDAPQGFSSVAVQNQGGSLVMGVKRVKKRANTDSSLSSKRKKHKVKKTSPADSSTHQGSVRAKSFDLGVPSSTASLPPLQPQIFIPSKAFVVEEDHNHFKCSYEGCTKAFRKENLLNYHIKYYHTDPETSSATMSSLVSCPQGLTASPLAASPHTSNSATGLGSPLLVPSPVSGQSSVLSTPVSGLRKRRKKTDSVCSTDSDLSVSSRGKSSGKRQRHDSEISVTGSPDLIPRDTWADVKLKAVADSPLEDNVEPEEAPVEADLVNCVCGITETNGLMIQCDVCMCWQHFMCVDTKGTGIPPTNYVCLACEKPKGVRDSCRYMYDMSFERLGELPTFSFSSGQNHQTDSKMIHLKNVANKCNALSSVLLGIKSALHSTRRQIKISKEEDDREFQLWQTDWDNWTKPEEDLTLTPHSVDPVPSPTPSTFLFPPTPTPPAISNLSTLSPSASSTNQDGNLKSPVLTLGDTNIPDDESTEAVPLSPDIIPTSANACASQESVNAISSSTATNTSLSVIDSLSDNTAPKSSVSFTKLTSLLSVSLSPEDVDASGAQKIQSSSVTPPSSRSHPVEIPSTPVSERRLVTSSTKDGIGGLVCDLFTGDSDDATSKSDSLKENNSERKMLDASEGKSQVKESSSNSPESLVVGAHSRQDVLSATSQTSTTVSTTAKTSTSLRLDTISSLPFTGKRYSPPSLTTAAMLPSASSTKTSSSLTTITAAPTLRQIGNKQLPHKSLSIINKDSSDTSQNTKEKRTDMIPFPEECFRKFSNTESQVVTKEDDVENIKERSKKDDQESISDLKKNIDSEKTVRQGTMALPAGERQDTVNSTNHIAELYIEVNEGQSNADDCEEDNDTDTAEESADPYRNCEHNLLVHISNAHSDMEAQLLEMERNISDLETSNLSDPTIQLCDDNVLNDIPALRKSLRKLQHNLAKVQQLSSLC